MSRTIAVDIAPSGVATITLNRPDRGNALTRDMRSALVEQFQALAANAEVRCIVLRGSGRHFCTGADVEDRTREAGASQAPSPDLFDVLKLVDASPKFTLAVVHGGCVGAGLAIACCCDVILATEQAFFSIPEVRLGIVPTLTPLFVQAIGLRAFRRFGLTGERISAAEGLRIGLVHQIVDSAAIDAAIDALADAVQRGAPDALAATKALAIRSGRTQTLIELTPPDMTTPEAKEGIAAFREKRDPRWYRK